MRQAFVAISLAVVIGPSAWAQAPADSAGESRDRPASLLARMRLAPYCFSPEVTEDQLNAILEQYEAMNPVRHALLEQSGDRYFTDSVIWNGDGGTGPSDRAAPAQLTYSFPADGVDWGLAIVSQVRPNELNAELTTLFGDVDLGREYLRQSLATWRTFTGLSYTEVGDDDTIMATDFVRVATRGDIRIGAINLGRNGALAYNAFPTDQDFVPVGGGDMVLNSASFDAFPFVGFDFPNDDFRFLRNTVSHEHGHGLGNIHTTPCDESKLMEPFISTLFDMLQIDGMRAGQRSYGDRFAPNHSNGDAHDFGDLTAPSVRSVIEPFLSTNGASGIGGTDEDWFRFTLGSMQSVTIEVTPIGGSYENGQQISNCSPDPAPVIDAQIAGNLNLELYDSTGMSLITSAALAGAGSAESIGIALGAGEYTVRVFDVGPNAAADQELQLYDLLIRIGASSAPPLASAGIGKRIGAGETCHFIGDINSRATEAGATLNASSYDWDLDGDGAIETLDQPRPTFSYTSSGVYPVSLQLTDSNGMAGFDTIDVSVFGGVTALNSITPSEAQADATTSITIFGNNLKNVASAGELSVSGAGVTVIGTPTSNALGTELTGLSLEIDAAAAIDLRDLTILNADGTDTLISAFLVTPGMGPEICVGDANMDNVVNFVDVTTILSNWLDDYSPGTGPGDANGDSVVNFADITVVLSNWLDTCP